MPHDIMANIHEQGWPWGYHVLLWSVILGSVLGIAVWIWRKYAHINR